MTAVSSEIETAWEDKVWTNSTITSYSRLIYAYAITEDSEVEVEKLIEKGAINFWQYTVRPEYEFRQTQLVLTRFNVDVSYFLEKDTKGEHWAQVRNAFEDLFTLVTSDLGINWQATVDYWQPQSGPFEISEVNVADQKVWRGDYSFKGFA